MTLKMKDIEFRAQPPALPKSIAVFALAAPSLEERREGIERLAKAFKLGDLRRAEMDDSVVLASSRGHMQYFHASGAVLARDATATAKEKDELRNWDGLQDASDGVERTSLKPDVAKKLIGQVQDLLEPANLLGKERSSASVRLQQVAHLDAKGREIAHGVGRATIKFGYSVEGLAVKGAGAKTLAFAEPDGKSARITGAFHAWRTVGKSTSVRLAGLEEALTVGLLTDPELELYHREGHKIEVHRLDFGYLALPAFMRQSHLCPAFQIEGSVSDGRKGRGFDFGRFHHAVAPKTYADAGLIGSYLAVNPDGIKPLERREQSK